MVWTGRLARRWSIGALVVVVAGLGAGPAAAQEQPSDVRLTVEAGFDGAYLRGHDVPVRVSVAADRLIQATLEITLDGGSTRYSVPVEVPGGSDKDVVVVLPTPPYEVGGVEARLSGDGDAVGAEAELDHVDDADELVGLLPGVVPPELPSPLALPVVDGEARFVEIDEDLLGAAPGSLGPLGTLVAGADELGRLDAATRAGILSWVARGGRLAIDAQPGSAVAGLPDEWQPDVTGRAPAGRGSVRLTAGAAAAGRWADVVEPTPTVSADEVGISRYSETVDFAVARDAGLDSIDAPWLVGFLVAYVLAAGPLVWLVLRARRRPALGWVAVPAVAVVFTAGAFVVGSDLRGTTRAAHASIVDVSPGGAVVTTFVGVVSRDGDDARVEFPARWTAGGYDQSAFGGPARAASVVLGADGAEAGVELAPADFATLVGTGPTTIDGAFRVEATAAADGVTGTVFNDTPYDLREVGVLAGERAVNVGTIAAGETATFSIPTGTRRNDPWAPPLYDAWPEVLGIQTGVPVLDSVVNLSAYDDATANQGPNALAPGLVTAIGWTRDYTPAADIAGQSDPAGRTGLTTTAVVGAAEGTIPAAAVRRELVRGADATPLPDDDVDTGPAGVRGSVWRFTLPAGAPGDAALELDVPGWMARVDVWDGTAWVPVVDNVGTAPDDRVFEDPTAGETVALPAGMVDGAGVVWLRGWLRGDFDTMQGRGFLLHGATGAEG